MQTWSGKVSWLTLIQCVHTKQATLRSVFQILVTSKTENGTTLSNPKYSCDSNQYPLINEYLIKLLELALAEKLSWRPYKVTGLFSTFIYAWNKKWCHLAPSVGFSQLSTWTCHFQPLNPPPLPVHLSHPFCWHKARDIVRSEIMKSHHTWTWGW